MVFYSSAITMMHGPIYIRLITLFSVPPFLTVPVQVLWMKGVKFIMDAVPGLLTRRPYFDERPVRVVYVLDPGARGQVSH